MQHSFLCADQSGSDPPPSVQGCVVHHIQMEYAAVYAIAVWPVGKCIHLQIRMLVDHFLGQTDHTWSGAVKTTNFPGESMKWLKMNEL